MNQAKTEFFNNLAARWDGINRVDKEKIETLIKLLNIKQGDTVLDVGTGTGILLPLLARSTDAANITALDSAENMIAAAKEKTGDAPVTFIVGDALTYPFAEKSFDKIICYSVFPHFDNKKETLRNLARALKGDGILAVIHSMSKHKINGVHIHTNNPALQDDFLVSAETLCAALRDLKLEPEIMIDNSEMYMAAARKRWHPGE
jgi:demethylmenaquinone methyltransferase/2-methoxy-6-polyprenyl-1,4-benzoquinol methylase